MIRDGGRRDRVPRLCTKSPTLTLVQNGQNGLFRTSSRSAFPDKPADATFWLFRQNTVGSPSRAKERDQPGSARACSSTDSRRLALLGGFASLLCRPPSAHSFGRGLSLRGAKCPAMLLRRSGGRGSCGGSSGGTLRRSSTTLG